MGDARSQRYGPVVPELDKLKKLIRDDEPKERLEAQVRRLERALAGKGVFTRENLRENGRLGGIAKARLEKHWSKPHVRKTCAEVERLVGDGLSRTQARRLAAKSCGYTFNQVAYWDRNRKKVVDVASKSTAKRV